MNKLASLTVALALCATAASAEPVTLSDRELDQVSAAGIGTLGPLPGFGTVKPFQGFDGTFFQPTLIKIIIRTGRPTSIVIVNGRRFLFPTDRVGSFGSGPFFDRFSSGPSFIDNDALDALRQRGAFGAPFAGLDPSQVRIVVRP